VTPAEQPLLDFLKTRGQLDEPPAPLYALKRAYLLNFMGLGELVDAAVKHDASANPTARGVQILEEIAQQTRRYQNQLIAARAVQTLAVLDVLNYQQIVDEIGEFDADADDEPDAEPDTSINIGEMREPEPR
jgi:hypothetical protein